MAKITPSFENGKQGIIKNLPLDFGVATTEVIPIKGIPSLSDREFLAYYLLRQDIRNELAQKMEGSTGRQRLSKTILEKLEIPLPPLPEQKSIAHTLRTIQKAKQTRQRELELERERKAALMQYLFTHGTQSYNNKAELQNTKIGYIPKHWYIEQCKNICEKISVGVVVKPASHYVEKGVPAFRSLNIKEDRISTDKLVFFSEEANNNTLSKSKLRTGDVLIVRTGYPGTSCVVPPEFEGANCIDLVFARPKTEVITSEYLSRYFNSSEGKRQALAAKTGLAQQHLNVNAVQRCLIPIPSLQEQNQITDVLIACDRKISSLEKEIAILDELFHAMLEQLMTGKISTKHLSEIHL
ncbi:MAG: restriction endonuclease subunit S [Cyanobacteria bacterium J06632_19]